MENKTKFIIALAIFLFGISFAVGEILAGLTSPTTSTQFLVLNTALENGNRVIYLQTYKNETYSITINGSLALDSREYDAEFNKKTKQLQKRLLEIEQASSVKTGSKYDGTVVDTKP
jgi:hypothetical protein